MQSVEKTPQIVHDGEHLGRATPITEDARGTSPAGGVHHELRLIPQGRRPSKSPRLGLVGAKPACYARYVHIHAATFALLACCHNHVAYPVPEPAPACPRPSLPLVLPHSTLCRYSVRLFIAKV
jgi:hypothetical protein